LRATSAHTWPGQCGGSEEVEAAISAAAPTIREALAGKLAFVARRDGAAFDLLALAGHTDGA
jgi:hypothetical protein